jgi:hypothetical protein
VQDVLERFAFDNICRVASDDGGPGVPGRGERGRAREGRVHARVQRRTERRHGAVHGAVRVKRRCDVEPERRMREALTTVHGYADRIVRERRERGGECDWRTCGARAAGSSGRSKIRAPIQLGPPVKPGWVLCLVCEFDLGPVFFGYCVWFVSLA